MREEIDNLVLDLKKHRREIDENVTRLYIEIQKARSKQKIVEELHKLIRRRYPRRKFEMRGLNETFQVDLVDMQKYSHENKSFKYLLTVIDIFSKYAGQSQSKANLRKT